jgi:hypothetical protein
VCALRSRTLKEQKKQMAGSVFENRYHLKITNALFASAILCVSIFLRTAPPSFLDAWMNSLAS